jgi:hypothetical protein
MQMNFRQDNANSRSNGWQKLTSNNNAVFNFTGYGENYENNINFV